MPGASLTTLKTRKDAKQRTEEKSMCSMVRLTGYGKLMVGDDKIHLLKKIWQEDRPM